MEISRLFSRDFSARVRDYDLPHTQGQPQAALSRREGIKQAELANLLQVQPISLGRLIDHMVAFGLSTWEMSTINLYVDDFAIVRIGLMQGLSMAFVVSPLSIAAFSTLAQELRTESASMFALMRNIGGSIAYVNTFLMLALLATPCTCCSGNPCGKRGRNPRARWLPSSASRLRPVVRRSGGPSGSRVSRIFTPGRTMNRSSPLSY